MPPTCHPCSQSEPEDFRAFLAKVGGGCWSIKGQLASAQPLCASLHREWVPACLLLTGLRCPRPLDHCLQGLLLKDQGREGDATRYFIQVRGGWGSRLGAGQGQQAGCGAGTAG